jgi:hypothetical protein
MNPFLEPFHQFSSKRYILRLAQTLYYLFNVEDEVNQYITLDVVGPPVSTKFQINLRNLDNRPPTILWTFILTPYNNNHLGVNGEGYEITCFTNNATFSSYLLNNEYAGFIEWWNEGRQQYYANVHYRQLFLQKIIDGSITFIRKNITENLRECIYGHQVVPGRNYYVINPRGDLNETINTLTIIEDDINDANPRGNMVRLLANNPRDPLTREPIRDFVKVNFIITDERPRLDVPRQGRKRRNSFGGGKIKNEVRIFRNSRVSSRHL